MTDREFKRLSRSQLIEIIYQFQLKQDELIAENARLAKALEEKRLRIEQAGNIAEAALAEAAEILAGAQKEAAAITQRRGKQENTPAKLREEKLVPAETAEPPASVRKEETPSIHERPKGEEDALLEDILSEFGGMSEL